MKKSPNFIERLASLARSILAPCADDLKKLKKAPGENMAAEPSGCHADDFQLEPPAAPKEPPPIVCYGPFGRHDDES